MSRDLLSVEPQLPLTEVAKRMAAKDVGAVLVIEGKELVGILTERDILRAVARGIDARHWCRPDDGDPETLDSEDHDGARRRPDDPRRLPPPARHRAGGDVVGMLSILADRCGSCSRTLRRAAHRRPADAPRLSIRTQPVD